MKVDFFSEKGRRNVNEDFVLSEVIDETTSLHIVADGMGGYSKGDVASKMVSEHIYNSLKKESDHFSTDKVEESIVFANKELMKYRLENNLKLGTTIAGVYISDNKAILFWVGDVHIYYFRDNSLLFESEDHSLINQLKQNHSNLNDIDGKNIRHIVTRSISGDNEKYKPDFYETNPIQSGDSILICSDGFIEIAGSTIIKKIALDKNLDLKQFKEGFIKPKDNASIISLKI